MTSLVLPAYNPGPSVLSTWRAVESFIAARGRLGDPWEAVFVLDGCTDGTPDTLTALAASTGDPRLRVVSYAPNRGKGFAVRTGLLAARGSVRVFTDIDLAYPFDDILRVAHTIRAGAPVAIGSRSHPESWSHIPAGALGYVVRRAAQGQVFGLLARLLLPISHRDTQAGLKGMTAEVAAGIVPELVCNGFGFDCELLTACVRAGVVVAEVPVCVRYDLAGTTTGWRSALRMVRDLWRIRQRWRRRTLVIPAATAELPHSRAA